MARKKIVKKSALGKKAATTRKAAQKAGARKPVVKGKSAAAKAKKVAARRPKAVAKPKRAPAPAQKKRAVTTKPKPARKAAGKQTTLKPNAHKGVVAGKKAAKKSPVKKTKQNEEPVKKAAPKKAVAIQAAPKTKNGAEDESKTDRLSKVMAARKKAAGAKTKPVPAVPEAFQPTGYYSGVHLAHDIQPFPKKTPYTKTEIERLRAALLEERQRLSHELTSLTGIGQDVMEMTRDHPGYSVHMAEHATDLQTAETNLGVRTIEEERLEQVDDALGRLRQNVNHFGLCLACGDKIGIQRLIARPHAHLCMKCRQKFEQIRVRRGY